MANFLKHQGLASMLKEGHQVFDDPVLKNIAACKELAGIVRTSYGPDGLCKLIVNHIGRVFVSHDVATIMSEMEVQHPAAKLLALTAQAMNDEVGDGTNMVLTFAGELLSQAEGLLKKGLHVSDIVSGYTKAGKLALEILPKTKVDSVKDLKDAAAVSRAIQSSINAKLPSHAAHITQLVTDACLNACPKNPLNFNVDNVRVAKVEGLSVNHSAVIHGFLITRDAEGTVKSKEKAKVVIYQCAVDAPSGDTKGSVVIETAAQLKNISVSEEAFVEKMIRSIYDSGATVVVSNQTFGDLAMHYMEQLGMMAIKITSKHELRRLSAAVNATQLATLVTPTPEDIGQVDQVAVEEIAGKKMVVFRQTNEHSRLSTIIIRGPTSSILDDVERAVNDGINGFKALAKNPDLVGGGGACELELAKELSAVAAKTPGLDQYAIRKYADSFLVFTRTLAEVSGEDATKIVDTLVGHHASNRKTAGFAVVKGVVEDVMAEGILDLLLVKEWAIRLATETVLAILRVDQIIMAKQAGGPKPPSGGSHDDD